MDADGRIGDLISSARTGRREHRVHAAGGSNGISAWWRPGFHPNGNLQYRMVDGAGIIAHAGAWYRLGYVGA